MDFGALSMFTYTGKISIVLQLREDSETGCSKRFNTCSGPVLPVSCPISRQLYEF